MSENTTNFLTPNNNAGFSTQHLEKMNKSLNFLVESLEIGRNNSLMFISWVEKDIDDLLNRKIYHLSDSQVGAEIRALVMRKREYLQRLEAQESSIAAAKRELYEVDSELNSRIQSVLNRKENG